MTLYTCQSPSLSMKCKKEHWFHFWIRFIKSCQYFIKLELCLHFIENFEFLSTLAISHNLQWSFSNKMCKTVFLFSSSLFDVYPPYWFIFLDTLKILFLLWPSAMMLLHGISLFNRRASSCFFLAFLVATFKKRHFLSFPNMSS